MSMLKAFPLEYEYIFNLFGQEFIFQIDCGETERCFSGIILTCTKGEKKKEKTYRGRLMDREAEIPF